MAVAVLAAALMVTAPTAGAQVSRPDQSAITGHQTTSSDSVVSTITRPRQVRILTCRRTVVDTTAQTVRCVRPRAATVWAVRSGGRWAVARSLGARYTVVPYVWSRPKRALVFSPRLAWNDRVGGTPSPTGPTSPGTPSDPGPPRKPETPAPPPPAEVPGQGSSASFSFTEDGQASDPRTARRWDRCTRIRWAADLSRAAAYGMDPGVALTVLSAAFSDAAAVTGYTFEFVGRADGELTQQVTMPERQADAPWSERYEIGISVGAQGDTAGYDLPGISGDRAGVAYSLWYTLDDGIQAMRLATVAIDADDLTPTPPPGAAPVLDESALYAVARHELAHVLGLAHVDDRTQLMYYSLVDGLSTYQNGDRAGLWLLASQPCFPSYD